MEYLIVVMLNSPFFNAFIEFIVVLITAQDIGELLIFCPLRVTNGTAETLPFLVVVNGDIYPALDAPAAVTPLNSTSVAVAQGSL